MVKRSEDRRRKTEGFRSLSGVEVGRKNEKLKNELEIGRREVHSPIPLGKGGRGIDLNELLITHYFND